MRVLELVGFRPEHWHYDYPDCYKTFADAIGRPTCASESSELSNSVLLAGSVGTGKSAMLAILCKIVFYNFVEAPDNSTLVDLFASRVKYCTHSELANIWSNEFNDSELPHEDYFKRAPVLFLDDLFSAPVNVSGRNTAKLEELIDWRWSNHLKTFIATNISLKDLLKPANKQYHRIARRLSESDWMYYVKLKHKFGGKR